MKKMKKDSAAIIIVVLLILIYVFYECYSVTHIELQTQTATLTTVYESVEVEALAVRDEHTVDNSASEVTVACLDDGDKINVGGNVGAGFSNSQQAQSYCEYIDAESKLEYYENLQSQTVGQAADVESVSDEIDIDVDDYIRSVESKNSDSVNSAASALNDSLLRRQMIIGEDVDLSSVISSLKSQMKNGNAEPDNYITTDESGVFSSYTDGYEQCVDYEKVNSLTADKISSLIKNIDSKTVKQTDKLGKLVTSYEWYFVCSVNSDDSKKLTNGASVDIALKDNEDEVISAEIKSNTLSKNGKTAAVVLKCNCMTAQLASLRTEDIEIRLKSYEGIKVPSSALHIKDGKKGVYVLISSQVKFRQADILYSDGDSVLLSYDSSDTSGIRIYDKIITQGKDLEDGKVYT